MLVQPSFLGTDNSRLCDELLQHADELRGVAVIGASSSPADIRRLDAAGVRGVRLNVAGVSHQVEAWSRAQWDTLIAHGWHVELHTDVGRLPEILSQLPADIPVVVDHMAKPSAPSSYDPTIACLRARSRSSSVHVKLSGAYRLEGRDAGAVAWVLRDELGQDSLLWGSDWPCTNHEAEADYPRLLEALWEWVGEEAVASALGRNAMALYWRGEARGDAPA